MIPHAPSKVRGGYKTTGVPVFVQPSASTRSSAVLCAQRTDVSSTRTFSVLSPNSDILPSWGSMRSPPTLRDTILFSRPFVTLTQGAKITEGNYNSHCTCIGLPHAMSLSLAYCCPLRLCAMSSFSRRFFPWRPLRLCEIQAFLSSRLSSIVRNLMN